MKRKRPFTLLEVIIAMALITVCAPILFTVSFRIAKAQTNSLFDLEMQRLADMEWNLIRLQIITRQTPAAKGSLESKTQKISFSHHHKKEYMLRREIYDVQEKELGSDTRGKLVKTKITFIPKESKKETSFYYQIALKTFSDPSQTQPTSL